MGLTYIINDARVIPLVSPWETDAFGQLNFSVAQYLKLDAVGVELGSADRVLLVADIGLVESDHLGAEKVTRYLAVMH